MELSLTLKGKGTLLITFGNQCTEPSFESAQIGSFESAQMTESAEFAALRLWQYTSEAEWKVPRQSLCEGD